MRFFIFLFLSWSLGFLPWAHPGYFPCASNLGVNCLFFACGLVPSGGNLNWVRFFSGKDYKEFLKFVINSQLGPSCFSI